MARLLIIANPVSGRGRAPAIVPEAQRILSEAGHSTRLVWTQRPGHAKQAASGSDAQWADGLISAGGDGTLHEVINGRGDNPMPVGIVPLGTGNVLAKEMRLPWNAKGSMAPVTAWSTRKVDLCELTDGRRFSCMLSAGIDGEIIRLLQKGRDGAIRMSQYLMLGLKALLITSYSSISVAVDGVLVSERMSYVTCANTHSFGGPIEIIPSAICDDSRVNVLTGPRDVAVAFPAMIGLALYGHLSRFP